MGLCGISAVITAILLVIHSGVVTGMSLDCDSEMFYERSSGTCVKCAVCPAGRRELRPCGGIDDRVCCEKTSCPNGSFYDAERCTCRECTRLCTAPYVKLSSCTARHDLVCRKRHKSSRLTHVPEPTTSMGYSEVFYPHPVPPVEHVPTTNRNLDLSSSTTGGNDDTQPTIPPAHEASPTEPERDLRGGTSQASTTLAAGEDHDTSGETSNLPWIVTGVLAGVVFVSAASFLVYCIITMTCHMTRTTKKSLGVASCGSTHVPLNNNSGGGSANRDVTSNVSQSDGEVPLSPYIGGFQGSTVTARDTTFMCVDDVGCEPALLVCESPPSEEVGSASTRCGDFESIFPRHCRSSMSMNNVFPAMSTANSKVWLEQDGRSFKTQIDHYGNGGVHCFHQGARAIHRQDTCNHKKCEHGDCYLSTFSIGSSVGSGCTV